jgi:hypothetical protein
VLVVVGSADQSAQVLVLVGSTGDEVLDDQSSHEAYDEPLGQLPGVVSVV